MEVSFPEFDEVTRIIEQALAEDIGSGDITSLLTIHEGAQAQFSIRAREALVVCGAPFAEAVFKQVDPSLQINTPHKEGTLIQKDGVLLQGSGDARSILAAERVALNLLRVTCGVATITRQMVDLISTTKATLLDTRKTIPGLRVIQKYAVVVGGGTNHRFGLDDAVLIKDNHISVCGSITKTVQRVRQLLMVLGKSLLVEIECDTIEQVKEALTTDVDRILLDNMNVSELTEAVALAGGRIPLEASGNVTLETVLNIAQTGVDFISCGMLTHSTPHVDIGLDIFTHDAR